MSSRGRNSVRPSGHTLNQEQRKLDEVKQGAFITSLLGRDIHQAKQPVGAGGSEGQGYPQLRGKFEAILDSREPGLKNKTKTKTFL